MTQIAEYCHHYDGQSQIACWQSLLTFILWQAKWPFQSEETFPKGHPIIWMNSPGQQRPIKGPGLTPLITWLLADFHFLCCPHNNTQSCERQKHQNKFYAVLTNNFAALQSKMTTVTLGGWYSYWSTAMTWQIDQQLRIVGFQWTLSKLYSVLEQKLKLHPVCRRWWTGNFLLFWLYIYSTFSKTKA